MKDIPVFTTEYGVAGLTLSQISYSQAAYVRIHASLDPGKLIDECVGFCRACGAEAVYGTGHEALENFPLYTSVIRMSCMKASLPKADVALWPVLPENMEKWREVYNQKMVRVPGSRCMSRMDMEAYQKKGGAYFVHREGELLGIGSIDGETIETVASCCPGAGREIVLALAELIPSDSVFVEVATANIKAKTLYENLGFLPSQEICCWYKIF